MAPIRRRDMNEQANRFVKEKVSDEEDLVFCGMYSSSGAVLIHADPPITKREQISQIQPSVPTAVVNPTVSKPKIPKPVYYLHDSNWPLIVLPNRSLNVETWTSEDVKEWMTLLLDRPDDLENACLAIINENVDGIKLKDCLSEETDKAMKELLGVKLPSFLKILNGLRKIENENMRVEYEKKVNAQNNSCQWITLE
uniref:SAM domain-containing protein n=1 Tax=Caenorhabditis tropicalis TaxID=1561998 RepID=A0A1I7UQV4_9PELO